MTVRAKNLSGGGSAANLHLIARKMWRVFARVMGRTCDEKKSRRKQRKKSSNSVWKSFVLRIQTGERIRTLSSFRFFRFWLQKGEEEKSLKRFRAGCSNRFVKELPPLSKLYYNFQKKFAYNSDSLAQTSSVQDSSAAAYQPRE